MNRFSILLTLAIFCLISCGKDDVECTAEDFNSKVSAQVTAFNNAITAFNQDNSDDNCNKLKEEGEAYIDLLKDFQDCENLSGADVAGDISQAEGILTQLTCN